MTVKINRSLAKHLKNNICVVLLLCCFPFAGWATHLVGGNLGYEYIGMQPDGTYRYRITATTYINCSPGSNIPDPEPELEIGIYENDLANPDDDKVLIAEVTVLLLGVTTIEPDLPDGCTVGLDVCLNEGTYEAFVDLPVNVGGYYLYYQRCCRNEQIVNLDDPGSQGVGFTALMPSPLVENSSPFFTGAPTPFLCANDTTSFLNTAIDPDGDQLIFSFITLSRGYSTDVMPNPGPEDPILNWPLPLVDWDAGFNVNQPFGATGYAFINGATGLTSYMAPIAGQYVVGVEIREFRDGILIGSVTRDIQLLVLNCPPNPAPNLTAVNGGETDFQVLAGDTVCFPVQFEDLNGDSLTLTSSGQIFDDTFTMPTAVIDTPQVGQALVTANFCWFTSCDQGQELPYQFTASVTDDGCPPKTASVVYQIEVIPFTGSTFIDGNPNPCESAVYQYETDDFAGATYNWTVTGGNITVGQGTNEISVDWGPAGPGTITVIATNHLGCVGDPLDLDINIQTLPLVDAGVDVELCLGDTVTIGGAPTGPVGAIFNWAPADSISDTAIENPLVFPSESTDYIVQVITGFSCVGEDTINVQVNVPQIDAGNDVNLCLGDTVELNGSDGTSYSWTPSATLTVDNIPNPEAFPTDTTTYFVSGPDVNMCQGIDSVTVFVLEQPLSDAGPDTTICGLTYTMQASSSAGIGLWRPEPGTTYSDDSDPGSQVDVTLEGIYTFTWVEDNFGCLDSAEVTIEFVAQPIANAGVNDSVCGLVYDLLAVPSVGLGTWNLPPGLNITNINDPGAQLTADDYGTYVLEWSETNGICSDLAMVEIAFIEQPSADTGPDDAICGLEYTLGATISVGTGTWSSSGGSFDPDENDPLATVSFANPGMQELIWQANNMNFCFAEDTVNIDFQEVPTADAGMDQSICGDSTLLEGSTTGTGTWTGDINLVIDQINDPNSGISTGVLGTYTVYWNTVLGTCTNIDSVEIEFLETPTANAGTDTPICLGDDLQLNGSAGDEYLWTPNEFIDDNTIANPTVNPDTTTLYFLEVSLNNGCTDLDSVLITVNPIPEVDAGEDIDYLCDGDSIQLNATPGYADYSWEPAADVSDPTIHDPYAIGDLTADYIITVTDDNNCMNSDTVLIVINGIVPTDAGPDLEICPGDTVQLGAMPVGPDGTIYSWIPADMVSNPFAENPLVDPTETTQFIVQSTNSICNGADTVIVTVLEIDEPDFEMSLVPGCSGLTVNFFNQEDENFSFLWDFGDGTTSTEYSPQHDYPFNGEFVVSLDITSDEDCTARSVQAITSEDFEDYFQIFVPNVITPNKDGENDVMDINIYGNIQECLNFMIFNRWGEVMFNSFGNNTRWDGYTNGGRLVSPGVYFYVIELNGQVYKGDIQVLY